MDSKPSVLLLSTSSGNRLIISQVLKKEGFDTIIQPKVTKPEEVSAALVDQFKKNFNPKTPSKKCDLIILNCRKNMEYRRSLEHLPKTIMKNRFSWTKEGINISYDDVSFFVESCIIINHFVMGADFIYQIEDNQKVRVSFGDINTDEFLSCANLFGEMGISFSSYFEKDLEPTPSDIRQYNEALKLGKQELMKKMAGGNVSGEEAATIINGKIESSILGQKAERMRKRFIKDIRIFLQDREKGKEVTKKRVDIVESADTFKQYLALKDEALRLKDNKNYVEMEKVLKKAIDLLEETGETGKKSLFDTFIELGKSQLQQKKFISSQRNAANAKKIRREAPSPQRLMGESQMGQATEALKSGNYEEAGRFFDRANEYMAESQNLAKGVEEEECSENEREMATSIAYFKEEAQKVVEADPNASEVLKTNIAFNLLTKTASDFKKKHKIVEEGEINPDISLKEVANKLREANKLLKTTVDPGACNELLRKLFDANADKAVEQLLSIDGLLASILENKPDGRRFERALIFIRFAMGYESSQKNLLSQKFHEINFNIARDQLEMGVNLLKEIFKGDGDAADNKNKAMTHFQKAFHQHTEIIEEVADLAVEHVQSVQKEFGSSAGMLLADMALKIEFSAEEKKLLEGIRVVLREIREIVGKARKMALEAADLVLKKKIVEARITYEQAVKIDELSAFKAVSGLAKDCKAEGAIKKAYSLYNWIARVDRNETDLQYINAAWCCLLLGDKERTKKHIEAALHINKNVIQEAGEMDPEFEQSDLMRFYKEEWASGMRTQGTTAAPPPKPPVSPKTVLSNENLLLIKQAAQALASNNEKGAYSMLRKLYQSDPRAFDKLIAKKPAVKGMPVYVYYRNKVLLPGTVSAQAPVKKPFGKEDLAFVMEANKLFMEGNNRDATIKLIQALKKDKMILVKACKVSEKFKQSKLMKFYFRNKIKLPKFLGFEPQP